MRTQHTSHSLDAFPVYSSAFVSPNELIVGGGGGQSRSGIKNKLRLYSVDAHDKLQLTDEFELDKGEDAPMSMVAHVETKQIVCGVNSSLDALKSGANQNCRRFVVENEKISFQASQNTLTLDAVEDDFQKVTTLSPDGTLLAAAGTRDFSLLHFPSLQPAAAPIHLPKGEIYDVAFSSKTVVVVTTVNLLVYELPSQSSSEESTEKVVEKQNQSSLLELNLLKAVDRPTLPGKDAGSSFRCARFHPEDFNVLYTVVNTVPPRTRTKHSPRRAFIVKWDAEKWDIIKTRQVSDRAVTCFDASANGKLLAFGSSDYTVGIIDSQTLSPLLTILKAHEFPPTTLKFNPTSNLLVSGSADNTIRVVTVPDSLVGASWSSYIFIIVTLLILLFAVIAQRMQ